MSITFNKEHLKLARRAASEGTVLLKNENQTLPLAKGQSIALFGRNQIEVFKGGGGAADLWAVPYVSFADALEKTGNVYKPMLKKYRAYYEANRNNALNKLQYKCTWSLPEVPLKDQEVEAAAAVCDTAVVFIGRFASESMDIKDVAGEYRITGGESAMMAKVTKYFKKTVLVLNLPGMMDMLFLDDCNFDAILQVSMPGMEAGNALSDVLYGDVTPCGKLPDSWAKRNYEYPTNETFSTEKVVYSEGIYMGYRYFDTFKKDVLFPFGYGLSYTDFLYETVDFNIEKTVVTINVKITNTGKFSGREIAQCYLSVPDGELEQPYQVLCGFDKTRLLNPDDSEIITIKVNLLDFTSYSEKRAAYILEKGKYIFRIGSHSRNTNPVFAVEIDETVVCRQVKNRLVPKEKIDELKKDFENFEVFENIPVLKADFSGFETEIAPEKLIHKELEKCEDCTFADVLSGKKTAEDLVACLSDEELARMLTADGPEKRRALGLENKELAAGEGTHTHPVKEFGIPSSVMQDGPAGVRASAFTNPIPPVEEIVGNDCIAYPSETMLAATWDRALMREIGEAITIDMDRYGYNGLCAPGVNLHRNPRCGRNFEYFSEDPYLSAEMAIGEILGIQQNSDGTPTGRYAVLKHFACNNSEDNRLEGDSVLSERCARDLYLKAFEYVIKRAEPLSIMGAYNKVNGEFACANSDLLDGICRTEWGYKGWIMTDWGVHTDSVSCVKAGADTVMPGKYVSFEEMCEKGLDRATAQYRATNLIKHLAKTRHHC